MNPTRRDFLVGGVAAASLTGISWSAPRRRFRGSGSEPVLVVLFLRGAADGLGLVVPYTDPNYAALRPTVRVAPGTELDLDGTFGLHPSLAPLVPMFDAGELAILHAVGSPHESRSHFDAQDFMERAAPGDPLVSTGWLNRYLAAVGSGTIHAGITLDTGTSPSLAGSVPTLAFKALDKFEITGGRAAKRRPALEAMHARPGTLLGQAATGAFETMDLLGEVSTDTAVVYPDTPFGDAMRDVAALIKADIGVRVVSVNLGGWDHHTDEVARLAASAEGLAATLAAYHADLGTDVNRTMTLAMTEFGRTAAENGSTGTDHGHGSIMLALGGGVAGGRVLLADDQWPGLAPQDLFEGRDLAVTTDFRDVFAEVLDRHMGLADHGSIFPGFTAEAANYPGLFL